MKNLLIDSLLTPIVESTYLNRDMCKFESSQKDESRWQSTVSSKAYRNTSALKCYPMSGLSCSHCANLLCGKVLGAPSVSREKEPSFFPTRLWFFVKRYLTSNSCTQAKALYPWDLEHASLCWNFPRQRSSVCAWVCFFAETFRSFCLTVVSKHSTSVF